MKSPRTKAITDRFIRAMKIIIHDSQMKQGQYKDQTAFAESIDQTPQNLNKITTHRQHAGIIIIEAIGRVHGVSANWLTHGIGEMFMKGESGSDSNSIARQLRDIASKVEQLNQPKLKRRA